MLLDDSYVRFISLRIVRGAHTEVGVRCRPNRGLLQLLVLLASRPDGAATVHSLVTVLRCLLRLLFLVLLYDTGRGLQILLA